MPPKKPHFHSTKRLKIYLSEAKIIQLYITLPWNLTPESSAWKLLTEFRRMIGRLFGYQQRWRCTFLKVWKICIESGKCLDGTFLNYSKSSSTFRLMGCHRFYKLQGQCFFEDFCRFEVKDAKQQNVTPRYWHSETPLILPQTNDWIPWPWLALLVTPKLRSDVWSCKTMQNSFKSVAAAVLSIPYIFSTKKSHQMITEWLRWCAVYLWHRGSNSLWGQTAPFFPRTGWVCPCRTGDTSQSCRDIG